MTPFVIGLVGGIASGKSTVAKLFREERECRIVDADDVARRVLERPEVRRALEERLPEACRPDGTMDRERLAATAFSDPRALAALEEVTHPPIRRAVEAALRRAREPYVVLDAALLLESGARGLCDVLVYVACPARTRRRRGRAARGWSEAHHRAREARQWSCRRKRAAADHVIDNRGDLRRTRRDVRRVLREIERRRRRDR